MIEHLLFVGAGILSFAAGYYFREWIHYRRYPEVRYIEHLIDERARRAPIENKLLREIRDYTKDWREW